MSVKLGRRAFIAMSAATTTNATFNAYAAGITHPLRPFTVKIPEDKIERIIRRVREAEWPDRMDAPDLRYGVSFDYMKALARHWTNDFDWRKSEASLNRHPQFLARVADFDIHFYHVRGKGPNPTPLILTHGWPGSVVEFIDAIDLLTDPVRHGGAAEDAFDVVVPSLPGYGFSSKPSAPIGRPMTAHLWDRLMRDVLGYGRYIAQGGDIGGHVSVQLALHHPDSLKGIHLNGSPENGVAPPDSGQSSEERDWRKRIATYQSSESDYLQLQQNKPQTAAFALTDSPIGLAAWMCEKLKSWSDSDDPVEPALTMDQVLTNVMLYLVTNTIGSSFWMYRGRIDDPIAVRRVEVPTGKVSLPRETPTFDPPRAVLERNYNLVHYNKLPRGGHFAFWEQPALMAADVREFARKLRV